MHLRYFFCSGFMFPKIRFNRHLFMRQIIYLSILLLYTTPASAQDIPSVVERARQADFIFEGRPINGGYSFITRERAILTLHYIIITKEFKGDFNSDTARIITLGGRVGNESEFGDDAPKVGTSDGIFFCVSVSTEDPNMNANNTYFIYG